MTTINFVLLITLQFLGSEITFSGGFYEDSTRCVLAQEAIVSDLQSQWPGWFDAESFKCHPINQQHIDRTPIGDALP